MTESEPEVRVEVIMYDANGNRTDDESAAVRAEVLEVDAAGNVARRFAHDGVSWEVDPKFLAGNEGALETRPRHPPA